MKASRFTFCYRGAFFYEPLDCLLRRKVHEFCRNSYVTIALPNDLYGHKSGFLGRFTPPEWI